VSCALLEAVDTGQVSRPSGRALVLHEGIAADDVDDEAAKRSPDTTDPCFGEREAAQLGENVDATRSHADLVDNARCREISGREVGQRRAAARTSASANAFNRSMKPWFIGLLAAKLPEVATQGPGQ